MCAKWINAMFHIQSLTSEGTYLKSTPILYPLPEPPWSPQRSAALANFQRRHSSHRLLHHRWTARLKGKDIDQSEARTRIMLKCLCTKGQMILLPLKHTGRFFGTWIIRFCTLYADNIICDENFYIKLGTNEE